MLIETLRLQLRPYTLDQVQVLYEDFDEFQRRMDVPAAEGLRELMTSAGVSPEWLARLHTAKEASIWEHGFALIHRENRVHIGGAGFAGPPDDEGAVEIGYGLAKSYQGQGYATEAARALVEFAFNTPGVRLVRAHTLPNPGPSPRVLEKCGFTYTGEVVSPEDGPVWRWELRAPSQVSEPLA